MHQDQITIRRLFLEEFVASLIDACTPREMRYLIEKQIHSPGRLTPIQRIPRRMSVEDQVKALERTFVPLALAIEEDKSIEKINKFTSGAPPKPGKEYIVAEKPIPRPMQRPIQKRPISQIIKPLMPKMAPPRKNQFSGVGGIEAEKPILIGGDFGFQDSEKMKYVLFLLNDPTVQSIECPGLGKQILTNKSGNIQVSNITLSKDEIDGIIQAISKKTKVPIVPGLFKAAFDNFLVTAVISEVAGTRFVIQKVYHPPSPPSPVQ